MVDKPQFYPFRPTQAKVRTPRQLAEMEKLADNENARTFPPCAGIRFSLRTAVIYRPKPKRLGIVNGL